MRFARRAILETERVRPDSRAKARTSRSNSPGLEGSVTQLPPDVLEAFAEPVFIIDKSGMILHSNSLGDRLMRTRSHAVQRTLEELAIPGRPNMYGTLTPLRGPADQAPRFLAVLRLPAESDEMAGRTVLAAESWRLTARQQQVLDLVLRGLTNADIGKALGIMEGTVEFHISSIFAKAGVQNRATLIAKNTYGPGNLATGERTTLGQGRDSRRANRRGQEDTGLAAPATQGKPVSGARPA